MNTQVQTKPAQETKRYQGVWTEAKVYVNEDRGTLTHLLMDKSRIEWPINYYKKILGIPFEGKEATTEPKAPRQPLHGFITSPRIFLSQDGEYLIHSVMGLRISKHINYYKRIFEAAAQAAAKNEALPA